ncbi:MAG: VOC family protein [Syntrophaceae bacterium]|nr:VOC family protein [Syntrophaceae bacterium]
MKPKIFDQFVSFIYCEDLEKTCQFYEKIIGLEMVLDQGPCRIFRVAPNAFLGVCVQMDPPKEKKGIIITFVTKEVNGWYEYLKQFPLVFEKTPQFNDKFNIYHLFVRDPAGYLVEIQEFKDPKWPQPEIRR